MSGRAYARDAHGFLGGGADLASIVPHTFRIAAPTRTLNARDLAIRRVIRRRCMEKNWKKVISRRHIRENESESSSATVAIPSTPPLSAVCDLPNNRYVQSINAPLTDTTTLDALLPSSDTAGNDSNNSNSNVDLRGAASASPPPSLQPPTDATTLTVGEEALAESVTVARAKQQLATLEAKLQVLVDQKHAKFVELKTILVQEARSKTSTTSISSTSEVVSPVSPLDGTTSEPNAVSSLSTVVATGALSE